MQFCQPFSFRDLQVDMENCVNNDILLDNLVYMTYQCTKSIPQHLFRAIHLVRTYLRTDFSTPLTPVNLNMYVFRLTVTALVLF